MTPLEALTETRRLIGDPDHWTMGEHATDNTGAPVNFTDPEASCFCVDGALAKVCGVTVSDNDGEWSANTVYLESANALRQAASDLFGRNSHIAVNDGEIGLLDDVPEAEWLSQAHANTLRMLDTAISTLA